MIQRFTEGTLTWIDICNPTQEEIHELVTETAIPLAFATDLTTMTPRSTVLAEKKALKMTLDFPVVKRTDIQHPHEIKFLATKKALITIRFEDIEAIHRFGKEFEVLSMLKSKRKQATGGHLLLTLLNRLYESLTVKLDYLESRMADIEAGVFAEKEKEMVLEISIVSKRLINFRQALRVHRQCLADLAERYLVTFSHDPTELITQAQTQYEHVLERTNSLSSTLVELRHTNNSLLTTKQNEVMKTFTILAFITFPLTLLTSLFSMNTFTTPIVGNKGDFWVILGMMILVSISFFAYFRYKKWM